MPTGLILNTILGIIHKIGDPYDAKLDLGGMVAYPLSTMAVAGRNKEGTPLQYAGSPFVALAVAKSMTELPYRHLQGSEFAITYQCAKHRNVAARIAPFKVKCAKHMFPKGSIHRLAYDEDVFTCIQSFICT